MRVEYTEIIIVREWIYFRHGEVCEDSIPWCLLGDIDYLSVHQLRRRSKKKVSENTEVRKRYEEDLTSSPHFYYWFLSLVFFSKIIFD